MDLELNEELKRKIDSFTEEMMQYDIEFLGQLAVDVMYQMIPFWNEEVKKEYFCYADHICGMCHKIDKQILPDYLSFVKQHSEFWGEEEKVLNYTIMELWVALTDFEFELSHKATMILLATFSLMCGLQKLNSKNFFMEVFAHLATIYDQWEDFISIIKQSEKRVNDQNAAGDINKKSSSKDESVCLPMRDPYNDIFHRKERKKCSVPVKVLFLLLLSLFCFCVLVVILCSCML